MAKNNKPTNERATRHKKRKDVELIAIVSGNIRHRRIKTGITQEELEDMTHLPITRYESGMHDMTLTTIGILSKHLNIKPHELLI